MSKILNNEELLALAALVNANAVMVAAANDGRKRRGQAMAYDEDYNDPAKDRLEDELKARGVLK